MKVEIIKLNNELEAILSQMKGTSIVSFGYLIKTGSIFENEFHLGISHFLEHLIFKGTASKNYLDISKAFEKLGASFNAYTDKRVTFFYASVLEENLFPALELLTEIVFHSVLPEEEIEKERNVILEEIAMYDDSPEDAVFEKFLAQTFGNHFLGTPILGTRQSLEQISRDTLMNYYSTYYTAQNTLFSIAGSFNKTEVLEKLNTFHLKIASPPSPQISVPKLTFKLSHETKDLEQTHFVLGIETFGLFDQKKEELTLLSSILGGLSSSRLFVSLREEKGLCYNIYSSLYLDPLAGLLYFSGATQPKNIHLLIELLLTKLSDMKEKNPISQEELEISKNNKKTALAMKEESTFGVMSRQAMEYFLYKKITPIPERLNKISAITLEQISLLTHQIFSLKKPLSGYIISSNKTKIPPFPNKLTIGENYVIE